MEHNQERLRAHILPLSESLTFEDAKCEWTLSHVEYNEDWDNCPCGMPIKELCYIRNTRNGNETYVGNVCVKRFMDIDTGNLFDGLKRIIEDSSANANRDVVEYALKNGFLYGDNEYKFLLQTLRKRNLSQAQLDWKRKINRRIVSKIVVRR